MIVREIKKFKKIIRKLKRFWIKLAAKFTEPEMALYQIDFLPPPPTQIAIDKTINSCKNIDSGNHKNY